MSAKESSVRGYFVLADKTPDRLLFTRLPEQRRRAGIALGVVALSFWGVAAYSILRPRQDLAGFVFFLLGGLTVAAAAAYFSTSFTELEFNGLLREIVRRRIILGRLRNVDALPFERVRSIKIQTTYGEVLDAHHIRVIDGSGSAWVTLPGYLNRNQADRVRQEIAKFIEGMEE